MKEDVEAGCEKIQERVKKFRELSTFPSSSRGLYRIQVSALKNRKKELKKVMEMALQQKVYIQCVISILEEVEDANDIQSQTVFQDFISKMNQDIEFIQSTLDWIDNK